MAPPLRLAITDYVDATRWRWVLSDGAGAFLADHTVHLDPASREYGGFADLSGYLDYNQPIYPPAEQLAALGRWMGEHVFGGVRAALRERRRSPAVAVRVVVPEGAGELLARPFELARFADGAGFVEEGVRFVYQVERAVSRAAAKEPAERALRILAAFSLPLRATALNLRRERFGLQRLVRVLTQTQGLAIELRVLHYGATRATLRNVLEEAEGWDVIHLSGHGDHGELQLEDEAGGSDSIGAEELGELLDPAAARLKLLILGTCNSGASSHAAARARVGLDAEPVRRDSPAEAAGTVLPSLALSLSRQLDCAAVAMRYPVDDDFATDLMLSLYAKLLDRRRPLPDALNLALGEALAAGAERSPLSMATPILVGSLAAGLQLAPAAQPMPGFGSLLAGFGIAFPPEPERFVGRMQPMLRATQALAPRSKQRGVLFYGMPGGGKTACALELAYRHEHGRFKGYVWYGAPQEGSDISTALFDLMLEIQSQLTAPDLGLTATLNDPEQFRRFTLPRLRTLLQQHSVLLVLDNLETLLTASGEWRDPLWGDLVAALLAHEGPSRVVFTSRRPPASLKDHPRVAAEPIHALSFAEGVLLARELPNLRRLFGDDEGRELLRATLRVVQAHPKLLELADGLAADRDALARRVASTADQLADHADLLDAFFTGDGARGGETRQDEAGFMRTLRGWTAGSLGSLPPPAALLFTFLCRLEPADRRYSIVEANWEDFLTHLGSDHATAAAAMGEPEHGLAAGLSALQALGLVAAERHVVDPAQREHYMRQLSEQAGPGADPAALLAVFESRNTAYTIHPGVAEAARAATGPDVLDAADVEMGTFHVAMVIDGVKSELEGGGHVVVASARRAIPYLLRQARWAEASMLLESLITRDRSPVSVSYALPLLNRITEAVAGTGFEQMHAGVVAKALYRAGRKEEAEVICRDRISTALASGELDLAASAATDLVNVLLAGGRLGEALAVTEEQLGYVRQGGLGAWAEFSSETQRVLVWAGMGRYDEVLSEVERLRRRLRELPAEAEFLESVQTWSVREALLDAGHSAAIQSGQWELAMAFNAEVAEMMESRGAGALAIARSRFNDASPLIRLRRYDEARALLNSCRAIFEAERFTEGLGNVFAELAALEKETGSVAAAVRFEEVALGYRYHFGEPEGCATGHSNLGVHLVSTGAPASSIIAHLLAGTMIRYQIGAGLLDMAVGNLVAAGLPPVPPSFAAVVAQVEAVEGVRFQALFDRLPRTVPDGDAAIAEVWRMAEAELRRLLQERALQLQQTAQLLHRIAAAAGDASLREELEPDLTGLEQRGWMLREPVHRLWAGERDAGRLTAGLDAVDGGLMRQILEFVDATPRSPE
jgi:hypothetical protein